MPTKSLTIPAERIAGAGGTSVITAVVPCFTLPASNLSGFYSTPIQLPSDFDASYPADIYIRFKNSIDHSGSGFAVAFDSRIWHKPPFAAPSFFDIQQYWSVPNPFANTDYATVKLLSDLVDPSDPSIPGGTLAADSVLCIRPQRNGNDSSDTYPNALNLFSAVYIVYHRRCQLVCCSG